LFHLGKITSDVILLVDAFKFVMHPNTDAMCKFSFSQMTNSSPIAFRLCYV